MLKVSIGIIKNDAGQFLMCSRTSGPYAGYWEFPGGKIEANESSAAACSRELYEEIGIKVDDLDHLGDIEHAYPKRTVLLNVFLIKKYSNIPKGRESQAIEWMSLETIQSKFNGMEFLPTTDIVLSLLDH